MNDTSTLTAVLHTFVGFVQPTPVPRRLVVAALPPGVDRLQAEAVLDVAIAIRLVVEVDARTLRPTAAVTRGSHKLLSAEAIASLERRVERAVYEELGRALIASDADVLNELLPQSYEVAHRALVDGSALAIRLCLLLSSVLEQVSLLTEVDSILQEAIAFYQHHPRQYDRAAAITALIRLAMVARSTGDELRAGGLAEEALTEAIAKYGVDHHRTRRIAALIQQLADEERANAGGTA